MMSGASLRGVVKRVGVWVRERSVINHNDNSLWRLKVIGARAGYGSFN
jgi:hypothetical protein